MASITVTVAGDTYTLREMNGEEFDSFVKDSAGVGAAKHSAMLVSRCLCDPSGVTVDSLMKWPFQTIFALGAEASKLNGLDKEATERAEKN